LGTFEAAWRRRREPKDPSNESIIGQVIVLCDGPVSLGPQTGKRPVKLGIPTDLLSDPETKESRERFRGEVQAQTELLDLVQEMESLVKDDRHEGFFRARQKRLDVLVTEFKEEAFRALKGRVKHVSKPTKQVVIRFSGPALRGDYLALPDKARLIFSGQASSVFGKPADDPSLFRKVEEPATGVARYETTWAQFKDALKDHRYGAYWLKVIEQAVFGAQKGGAALDANLALVAENEQRHRVVATTVTTFFNNDCEVSLYLIEALQRRDRGDEATSDLLNGITIICRFRFAFLEFKSEFYHENFRTNYRGTLQSKAKELLTELDYLRSEAIHANLEKPGAWLEFMKQERLNEMMKIWRDVDQKLRGACDAVIAQPHDTVNAVRDIDAPVSEIVAQLKRIHEEVRPFNGELGEAIARKLAVVFEADKRPSAS
jgi:hypothetical protein